MRRRRIESGDSRCVGVYICTRTLCGNQRSGDRLDWMGTGWILTDTPSGKVSPRVGTISGTVLSSIY
jgi:hypothetical protein